MTHSYDAVIVGGGIVGAACALECARAGMCVAIVERDVIGSGATAAAMGHIVVMDNSPAQFALTSYSQSLWNALSPELPVSVEYDRCGTLWIAADEAEMAEVGRKKDYYETRQLPAEILDSAALAEREPNLRRQLGGALLVSSDAVIHPLTAAKYLIDQAEQIGATVLLGKAATQSEKGSVRLEDGTTLLSPRIVNATGAISPALTPGISVRKRKGHLVITDRYPGYIRHQLVELGYLKSAHSMTDDSVAFNVQPRRNGQLLIGSSRQSSAEEPGVEQQILARMIERAQSFLPGLTSLSALRVWTGFRAATPDNLPLIGPTEDPTVFLATGHEGLGITTSLATARLLVDCMLQRESPIPIEPYLPSRPILEGVHA